MPNGCISCIGTSAKLGILRTGLLGVQPWSTICVLRPSGDGMNASALPRFPVEITSCSSLILSSFTCICCRSEPVNSSTLRVRSSSSARVAREWSACNRSNLSLSSKASTCFTSNRSAAVSAVSIHLALSAFSSESCASNCSVSQPPWRALWSCSRVARVGPSSLVRFDGRAVLSVRGSCFSAREGAREGRRAPPTARLPR